LLTFEEDHSRPPLSIFSCAGHRGFTPTPS
jgi:hypothetical protein